MFGYLTRFTQSFDKAICLTSRGARGEEVGDGKGVVPLRSHCPHGCNSRRLPALARVVRGTRRFGTCAVSIKLFAHSLSQSIDPLPPRSSPLLTATLLSPSPSSPLLFPRIMMWHHKVASVVVVGIGSIGGSSSLSQSSVCPPSIFPSIHPSFLGRPPRPASFLRSSLPLSLSRPRRRPGGPRLSGSLLLDDPVMAAAAPFGRWFGRSRRWNRARFQSVQLYATGGNDGRRRRRRLDKENGGDSLGRWGPRK